MNENTNNIKKTISKYISVIVVVVCSGVFTAYVWNNNVWMDEAFTASLVSTNYLGVLYRSMMDTLPPLYNLYLKTMTLIFGYTVPVMKISSIIPMILTLIMGMTVVKRRFGFKVATLFDLLITFMPLMIYYGVEIRMYSLGFFFATASGIYAYELVCDYSKKNRRLFVLFSVLAGYSHHFAFVTVGFVFLYLLLYYFFFEKKNIKRWFICLLYTFIFYLPCLVVTLKQLQNVSGYFSMPEVDLHLFIQYVLYPYSVGRMSGSVTCMALMGIALILFLYGFVKKKECGRERIYAFLCFTVYYGVLVFGTIISKVMTANIFVDRYLFFSTGLLWLFVAIIYGKSHSNVFIIAGAATIFVGINVCLVEYQTEYSVSADEEIRYLRANVKENDAFLGLGGHEELENCIPFYCMVDKETSELLVVYNLSQAMEYLEHFPESSVFVGVMPDYEFTEEDREMFEKCGVSCEKQADFDFDRYTCEMYVVRK